MLLTRSPLYSGSCPPFLARLACVRHAASVRSEPGSNSPVELEDAESLSVEVSDVIGYRPCPDNTQNALSVTALGPSSAPRLVWKRGATI